MDDLKREDGPQAGSGSVAAEPRSITLAGAADFEGFRRACRTLWAEQVEPGRVAWHTRDDVEADLFESTPAAEPAASAPRQGLPPFPL